MGLSVYLTLRFFINFSPLSPIACTKNAIGPLKIHFFSLARSLVEDGAGGQLGAELVRVAVNDAVDAEQGRAADVFLFVIDEEALFWMERMG